MYLEMYKQESVAYGQRIQVGASWYLKTLVRLVAIVPCLTRCLISYLVPASVSASLNVDSRPPSATNGVFIA